MYIHTLLPSMQHIQTHTYIYTYIHTCMHIYIPTYIHTYIHTRLALREDTEDTEHNRGMEGTKASWLNDSTGTEEGGECGHGQEAKVALQEDTEDTERKRGM